MRRSTLIVFGLGFSLTCSLMMGADKKGDAEKGKEVFQQCGVCHNADSAEKKMGPGLKGLFKAEKMANGKKPTEATSAPKSMKVAMECRPTKRCCRTKRRTISWRT